MQWHWCSEHDAVISSSCLLAIDHLACTCHSVVRCGRQHPPPARKLFSTYTSREEERGTYIVMVSALRLESQLMHSLMYISMVEETENALCLWLFIIKQNCDSLVPKLCMWHISKVRAFPWYQSRLESQFIHSLCIFRWWWRLKLQWHSCTKTLYIACFKNQADYNWI